MSGRQMVAAASLILGLASIGCLAFIEPVYHGNNTNPYELIAGIAILAFLWYSQSIFIKGIMLANKKPTVLFSIVSLVEYLLIMTIVFLLGEDTGAVLHWHQISGCAVLLVGWPIIDTFACLSWGQKQIEYKRESHPVHNISPF